MKIKFLTILSLFLFVTISAQEIKISSSEFVRVFNKSGKKIGKGYITKITDSQLTLTRRKKEIILEAEEVNMIKTKHSAGHYILINTIPGLAWITGSMIFINNDWSAVLVGGVVGSALTIAGATIGIIKGLTKKTRKFQINGDLGKLLPAN